MSLYDPQEFPTETTVSPDFTPEDVLAWARTKPADEAYRYTSHCGCAVAQYLLETGRAKQPHVIPYQWREGDDAEWRDFDGRIEHAVDGSEADGPNTFGAFADRLEKALSK